MSGSTPAARKWISPAAPACPRCSSPRRTSPAPRPGADRDEREVVDAAADAEPALAERGEVDVVLDGDGNAEARRELRGDVHAFEALGFAPRGARARRRRSRPGRPRRRSRSARTGRPAAAISESRRPTKASSAFCGAGAPQLDVLACAHGSLQVADRAAQEARAEVEPQHERRVGHRLEEDGAVARPARDARPPRARAPRRGATGAPARRSAWRCLRGARSLRARSARRRGSPRAPSAR